eukprot:scaffold159812_cov31-Tisochrysis_lutea.AAC.2
MEDLPRASSITPELLGGPRLLDYTGRRARPCPQPSLDPAPMAWAELVRRCSPGLSSSHDANSNCPFDTASAAPTEPISLNTSETKQTGTVTCRVGSTVAAAAAESPLKIEFVEAFEGDVFTSMSGSGDDSTWCAGAAVFECSSSVEGDASDVVLD